MNLHLMKRTVGLPKPLGLFGLVVFRIGTEWILIKCGSTKFSSHFSTYSLNTQSIEANATKCFGWEGPGPGNHIQTFLIFGRGLGPEPPIGENLHFLLLWTFILRL